MPGDDWISNFVIRNQLLKRTASNIQSYPDSGVTSDKIEFMHYP